MKRLLAALVTLTLATPALALEGERISVEVDGLLLEDGYVGAKNIYLVQTNRVAG